MRKVLFVLLALAWAQAANAAEYDCVINPAVMVKVGSPIAGLIDEVYVKRGDKVKKGDKIARLRSRVEETTVALDKEQATNTAEIEAQQARLSLSQSKLERAEKLERRNISSTEKLEEARAQSEVISHELAIAEMHHRTAQLELERARELLAQRTIRSPIDGVVLERALYDGEFLTQDAHVVTLAQIDPLYVEAFVPVESYGSIQIGMTGKIRPHKPIDGVFYGIVTVVDSVFDVASGTFGIRLRLDNPDGKIPAGHRCTLTFDNLTDQQF
jgi:RND family efflux transporter MFP subunit